MAIVTASAPALAVAAIFAVAPLADEAPAAADRAWWAAQNTEFHATDLVTPETDGIDAWTLHVAELAADYDAGRLPTWID